MSDVSVKLKLFSKLQDQITWLSCGGFKMSGNNHDLFSIVLNKQDAGSLYQVVGKNEGHTVIVILRENRIKFSDL